MTGFRNDQNGARHGLTLIEVLVALSIVGVLLALLVPAVMVAREAARRGQCMNNLRQISIAMNSYLANVGTFPMGYSRNGFPFQVVLLPYLERRDLYQAINFDSNGVFATSPENYTVSTTRLSGFICPSDPVHEGPRINYVGNRGSGVQKFGYNGIFMVSPLGAVGPSDCMDGLANTAAVCEWLACGADGEIKDRRRSVFQTQPQLTEPGQFDQFVGMCRSIDVAKAKLGGPPCKGMNWLFSDFGFTLYNHVLTPNQPTCTNGTAFQQGAWTAGSLHPGGVNVAFADGHVKFINDSIDLSVWRALGSRNGAEVVSAADY